MVSRKIKNGDGKFNFEIQGHGFNSISFNRMENLNKHFKGKLLVHFSHEIFRSKMNPTETGNCYSTTFIAVFLFFHKMFLFNGIEWRREL